MSRTSLKRTSLKYDFIDKTKLLILNQFKKKFYLDSDGLMCGRKMEGDATSSSGVGGIVGES